MKKILFAFSIALAAVGCQPAGDALDREVEVYQSAMALNDYSSAANSILRILAIDSSQHEYLDTLTKLYFNLGNMPSTILAGEKALAHFPNDKDLLIMVGEAYRQWGAPTRGLVYFEQVADMTHDPLVIYEVGITALYSNQLGKAAEAARKIIDNPVSDTVAITLPYGANNEKQQAIPVVAAAFNLLGQVNTKAGNTERAAEHFQQALEIAPDFELAQKNLAARNEELRKKK